MIHELKCSPEFFKDMQSLKKPFEVRKNDRPYKVNDFIALNEYDKSQEPGPEDPAAEPYSGRCMLFQITYILSNPSFCKDGYVVLGALPCFIDNKNDSYMIEPRKRLETYREAAVYGR